MKSMFAQKDCGGKEIIVECGLAIIAVALLIVFRKQIGDLTKTVMDKCSDAINTMFETSTLAGSGTV